MSEDWERQGNTAFIGGWYAQAITFYERAEECSDHPGRVAFNHGAALFQHGKYREAERYFRSAIESAVSGDRKARALYNLGTCLMHVADGRDADRLAEAISCFNRCMKATSAEDDLVADARNNLELAKMLWRRIRSGEAPPPDRDPTNHGDDRPPDKPPDGGTSDDPGTNPSGPSGSGGQRVVSTQPSSNGPEPTPTSQGPPPGAGHSQPIPDAEQMQPLPPGEARELLRLAEERIARERRMLQKAAPPGDGKNYPDW